MEERTNKPITEQTPYNTTNHKMLQIYSVQLFTRYQRDDNNLL